MDTLSVGDIVCLKDGGLFRNGQTIATVQAVEGKEALLLEPKSWSFIPLLMKVDTLDALEPTAVQTHQPTGKIASDGGTTDYYKLPAHATELRHLIAYKGMNFHIGNIFKAAYRLGEKEGIDHRYDLKKIISMAEFELEELDRAEGLR